MTGALTLAYGQDPWADLDDGLRFYQRDIALQALQALRAARAVLVVAATGLGKTQIFAAIIGDWQGKVLVLCHRDELIDQARRRIEHMTGEWVQIEQGPNKAELATRIVVASVDSLRQRRRLEQFPPDHFSLIIVDEAHHYAGNTYVRPLEHFSGAKVIGFTATPDRADEVALGKTFDAVAATLDISAGIDMGYLVPIIGQEVTLAEIDLSGVDSNKSDLVASQLDAVMLKAVEGVVRETIRLEPTRQGICFFPGVKSAEYAAQKFNVLLPGSARFISAETPPDERRQIVQAFRRGEFRYLTNCMIATEGFDAPSADLIVLARPTKSRSLYTQMIGRGTRVLPGTVDHLHGRTEDAERRAAVAASKKPNLCVLDFVGNAGRHELIMLEDVLGGRYTDAERKTAKKIRKEHGGDPVAALEAARRQLHALAHAVQARVRSDVRSFDPFKALRVEREGIVDHSHGHRPCNATQRQQLLSAGVPEEDLEGLSRNDAAKALEEVKRRRILGLCTLRQLRLLTKYGMTDPNLSFQRASVAISYIQSKQWGRGGRIDPAVLHRVATYQREPGEEG